MKIISTTFLSLIFLSLAFNFTIIEGGLYFSNVVAFLFGLIIFLNFQLEQLVIEKSNIFLLFIISIFITLTMDSLNGLKWLYIFYMFYFFFVFFKNYKFDINNILTTYSLGLTAGTILSFQFLDISYIGYNLLSNDFRGSIDSLGGYNTFGVLAAYAILILIHLQNIYKNILLKIVFLLSIIILFTAEISTLSRGGMLSLFFGIFIYGYLRKILVKNLILAATTTTIFILIMISYFDLDFSSIYSRYSFLNDATGSGRTRLWSYAISQMNNPFVIIFGHGAGSIDLYASVTEGLSYNLFESSHSTYIDIFYEFGLIGLCLFITFLFRIKNQLDKIDSYNNQIILKTLFYVMIINMFFDSYFFSLQISAIYSMFYALFNGARNA